EVLESRKQLANIRVVQKNLVSVHSLPLGLNVDDRYKRINNIFKEFCTIVKFVINNQTIALHSIQGMFNIFNTLFSLNLVRATFGEILKKSPKVTHRESCR
ncbi:hypothetical protein TNCT_517731, partial [Trichonephila clavata]